MLLIQEGEEEGDRKFCQNNQQRKLVLAALPPAALPLAAVAWESGWFAAADLAYHQVWS